MLCFHTESIVPKQIPWEEMGPVLADWEKMIRLYLNRYSPIDLLSTESRQYTLHLQENKRILTQYPSKLKHVISAKVSYT